MPVTSASTETARDGHRRLAASATDVEHTTGARRGDGVDEHFAHRLEHPIHHVLRLDPRVSAAAVPQFRLRLRRARLVHLGFTFVGLASIADPSSIYHFFINQGVDESGRPAYGPLNRLVDDLEAVPWPQTRCPGCSRRSPIPLAATSSPDWLEGDLAVNELAAPYDISVQAVSKHLRVLEDAGLVSRPGDATRRPAHLEAEVFDLMTKWIERYRREAEERYRRLDDVLASLPDDIEPTPPLPDSPTAHSPNGGTKP